MTTIWSALWMVLCLATATMVSGITVRGGPSRLEQSAMPTTFAVPVQGAPGAVGASTHNSQPTKPRLHLTFQVLILTNDGRLRNISADRSLLAIAARELPLPHRTNASIDGMLLNVSDSRPQDALIVDLKGGHQFMHQRFFDELVCYEHDMQGLFASKKKSISKTSAIPTPTMQNSSSVNSTNSTTSTKTGNHTLTPMQEAMREAFVGSVFQAAVGDVLSAPLDMYDVALNFTGSDTVGGMDCNIWEANQTLRLSLKDMMAGLSGQKLLGFQGVISEELGVVAEKLDDLVGSAARQNQSNHTEPMAAMHMEAAFCVTERGGLMATKFHRSLVIENFAALHVPVVSDDSSSLSPERGEAPVDRSMEEREQVLQQLRASLSSTFRASTSAHTKSKNPLKNETDGIPESMTVWESAGGFLVLSAPVAIPPPSTFSGNHNVAGGRCIDLTSGTTGEQELDSRLNSKERLRRINREAGGSWKAAAYDIWQGMIVADVVPALGTHIEPLRLPLGAQGRRGRRHHRHGGLMLISQEDKPPVERFDARLEWPQCLSIGYIRNQGMCGSCWAFAATGVLSDRLCIAATRYTGLKTRHFTAPSGNHSMIALQERQGESMHSLALSPEHLVDCDGESGGCGGGRLDDVWWYLRDHGAPSEHCHPYKYCPVPTEPQCHYGKVGPTPDDPHAFMLQQKAEKEEAKSLCEGTCHTGEAMRMFHASAAYAVGLPGDVVAMQRDLLTHGSLEVGFFVFSDFHSYKQGVYFRTPAAYGPLGGHAVRLIGWGVARTKQHSPVDYWTVANSWSPAWGMGGFFRIRRGTNECGIETTPAAGLPSLSAAVPPPSHTGSQDGPVENTKRAKLQPKPSKPIYAAAAAAAASESATFRAQTQATKSKTEPSKLSSSTWLSMPPTAHFSSPVPSTPAQVAGSTFSPFFSPLLSSTTTSWLGAKSSSSSKLPLPLHLRVSPATLATLARRSD